MFRADTDDVVSFVKAAGLAPYFDLGFCVYIYIVGPENLDSTKLSSLFSSISSLTSSSISPTDISTAASTIAPLAESIVDNCVIREVELNYMCVGTPYGVYTDPRVTRRRSRALLGDDDRYKSSQLFPFFTRFAISTTIKAKINTLEMDSINTSGTGGTWQSVKFNIDVSSFLFISNPPGPMHLTCCRSYHCN